MASVTDAAMLPDLPPDLGSPDLARPPHGTWTLQIIPNSGFCGVWAADLNLILIGGAISNKMSHGPAVIFRSTDDGFHWEMESVSLENSGVFAIWGSDSSNVWAVGEGSPDSFWESIDSGQHWMVGGPNQKTAPVTSWADIQGKGGVLYAAAIIPSTVVLSRDNGQTWSATPTPPPTNLDLYSIWVADSGRIWVGAADPVKGNLFFSDDMGRSWLSVATGQPFMFSLRAWGFAHDLYVGGRSGFIAHSSDEGMNWTVQASGVTDEIMRFWGSSASDVYAVAQGGNILHTIDRGAHWKTEVQGANQKVTLWGVSGVGGEVFAVGERGAGFGKEGFDGVIYHRY